MPCCGPSTWIAMQNPCTRRLLYQFSLSHEKYKVNVKSFCYSRKHLSCKPMQTYGDNFDETPWANEFNLIKCCTRRLTCWLLAGFQSPLNRKRDREYLQTAARAGNTISRQLEEVFRMCTSGRLYKGWNDFRVKADSRQTKVTLNLLPWADDCARYFCAIAAVEQQLQHNQISSSTYVTWRGP